MNPYQRLLVPGWRHDAPWIFSHPIWTVKRLFLITWVSTLVDDSPLAKRLDARYNALGVKPSPNIHLIAFRSARAEVLRQPVSRLLVTPIALVATAIGYWRHR